jgi:GT2 family glycosyltransferase
MTKLPVSVILVSMNNLGDVSATLNSLTKLIEAGVEILIVDSSQDNRIRDLITSYNRQNIEYLYMEPSGIYSAMNLGAKSCTPGNYIWFLNPGDILPDSEQLVSLLVGGLVVSSLWIYGQANVIDTSSDLNFPKLTDSHTLAALTRGSLRISHQAMLVRTDLFNDLSGFDTRYKICSDLDFQIRLLKHSPGYFQQNVVAHIDPNGISHQKILITYFETFLIRMRSGDLNLLKAASITIKNLGILVLKKLRGIFHES